MQKGVIGLRQAKDLSLVGGKAFALHKMIKAGFNVPEGFVVTSKTDPEKIILREFKNLSSQYVAVRSSAAYEDSKDAAWAGQLDTFLNVQHKDLLVKIQACFNSAGSERAKSYAKQKGLKSGSVAVIVQAMVQSEVSGIAFSVNPVTKSNDEIVIEAGFGLNEPIVSGEITPDTYIANKASGNLLQKHISAQERKLMLGADGKNEWQKVSNPNSPKLSDSQIQEVTVTVTKLEKFFSLPVDVEWTFAGSKLYLLQCRPITTLG